MVYVLDGIAMSTTNIVVAPHRIELRTLGTELFDEWTHLRGGPRPRRVQLECAHHETRHAVPFLLDRACVWIEEHHAQQIALLWRQRAIVGQHHGCRPIP